MSVFHIRDTLTLVAPDTFAQRLTSAGFIEAQADIGSGRFRFSARRPIESANITADISCAVADS
jgi:hypothetical protein